MEERKIPNHLVYAIIVTLCCCLPFGVVSIIQAAKVNSLVATGDLAAARAASDQAKKWATIGLVAGIISNTIVVIIQVMAAMAQASSY